MIDILLATYNSEKYLSEQIDSIIEQNCDDWELLIRDGGSGDKTSSIIQEYCFKYPDKIKQLPSHEKSSALENFSALLDASTSSYVMFADHDDIWLEDKVNNSLIKMKESEILFGSSMPLLIFTDMYIVDENLKRLSCSYFKYQKLNPLKTDFNYLLTQNIPNGCTMLINRHLLDLLGKIPITAVMHDHWLSLVATTFGKIIYLDKATLLYRQHEKNIFGANAYGWSYFYRRFKSGLSNVRKRFYLNAEQAKAFQQQYGEILSKNDNRMLNEFANIKGKKFLERRKILWKYKIYKSGRRRNIGTMLII